MPPGVNATLTKVSTTRFELQMNTGTTTNVYDANGATYALTQTLDTTRTNTVTYTYAGGNLSKITDTQGRVVTFAYTDPRNLVQPSLITDTSLNRSLALVYGGPGGALTQITDAAGGVTTLGYDTNNKLNRITDPKNQVTRITYDTAARATTLDYATGATADQTFTVLYFRATTTFLTGPSAAATGTANTVFSFNDGASGTKRVTRVSDPNSNATQAGFDTHDNQTSTTNGLSQQSKSEFDATTNVLTKATDPGVGTATGAAQTYTYGTAAGNPRTNYRPATGKDDQGNTTTYGYDPDSSNISAVYTAGGARGTLVRRYQGDNANTGCGAPLGQLCSSTDGKGQVTTYTWDTTKNLTRITPPAPLGPTVMTYDAAGRMLTKTDGNNSTATYSYDALDRMTRVTYGSNGSCSNATCTTWTFDPVGNLTQRVDASGTTTYTYDAQNRVTSKTLGQDTTSLAYDRAGNISSYTDTGGQVTYGYDNAHRQVSLAEPNGSCPTTKPAFPNTTGCTWFDYDQANRRTATTFPTGFVNTTGFDNAGKITTITAKTSAAATTNAVARGYTYTPGPDGGDGTLRTSVTNEAGLATTYGYDAFRQLRSATTGSTTEAWTYDLNGNRTSAAKTGTATQYFAYNAADQLCYSAYNTPGDGCANPPAGSLPFSYDANGNTLNGGSDNFSYNSYDQVTEFWDTDSVYVPFGYADTGNSERTSAGNTTFVNGLLGVTKQTTSSGPTLNYIRDAAGTLIALRYNGVSSYYTTDALGSVIYLSPGNNSTATSYTYDSWGNTTSATGALATINPYRYATGYYDAQTGLTKMGARYYSSALGRFTQVDPSGKDAHYMYAGNNPISNLDPSGYGLIDGILAIGGFVTFVGGIVVAAASASILGITFALGGAIIAVAGLGLYIGSLDDVDSGGTFCNIDNEDDCITYVN